MFLQFQLILIFLSHSFSMDFPIWLLTPCTIHYTQYTLHIHKYAVLLLRPLHFFSPSTSNIQTSTLVHSNFYLNLYSIYNSPHTHTEYHFTFYMHMHRPVNECKNRVKISNILLVFYTYTWAMSKSSLQSPLSSFDILSWILNFLVYWFNFCHDTRHILSTCTYFLKNSN